MPTNAPPKPPLSRAYTLKASKIPNYFKVLLENPEPEVFDTAFLAKSGFRYAIDRTFIDILKGLGFLNEAGQPTRRYRDFRDNRQAATALRLGLSEAYAGLLAAMPDAAACSEREIMEAVSRYFEGEINDMAACGIAATFLALTRFAAGLDNGSAIADAAQRPAVTTLPASEPAPAASASSAMAVSKPVAAPGPVAAVSPASAVAQTEAASPQISDEAAAQNEMVAPQTEATALAAAPLSAVAAEPVPPTAMTDAPEPAVPVATPAVMPEAPPQAVPTPAEAADGAPTLAPETTGMTDGAPGFVIEVCAPEARNQAQDTPQRPIIHITLPVSTDQAVYDAIFASLKRHLLSPGDNA